MRLAFIGCCLALLGACSTESAPPPLMAVDAVAISDISRATTDQLQLTGTVRARTETDLSFRVSGLVTARPAGLGSTVKAGEVLAELDAADLQSAASAAAASARSAELEAQAAASSAALAAAEEARLRGLDGAGAISALAYERARDQAAIAQQQARAATSRAQALHAQAELAANQARHARLVAPADGVVVDAQVEPGQVLQAGMPVIRFAAHGDREIEVFLPETELAAARQPASVLLTGAKTALRAELREMAAAPDPATRTYRARFRLIEQPQARPTLGSTASLKLQRAPTPQGLTVPVSAVVWRDGQSSVAVVDAASGKVTLRAVEVLQMGSEVSRVRGSLNTGELLVRSGGHALSAGQMVRVLKPKTGG